VQNEDLIFAFQERLCSIVEVEILTNDGKQTPIFATKLNDYLDSVDVTESRNRQIPSKLGIFSAISRSGRGNLVSKSEKLGILLRSGPISRQLNGQERVKSPRRLPQRPPSTLYPVEPKKENPKKTPSPARELNNSIDELTICSIAPQDRD
jgi:hypothetical protein